MRLSNICITVAGALCPALFAGFVFVMALCRLEAIGLEYKARRRRH